MQRRSFIKSTLGMFACLAVNEIRPGIPMDLMNRLCDQDIVRFDCSKPFVENGNAVATDARIAVRVFDSMGIADLDSPLKLPPVQSLFDRIWRPDSKWYDWPSANYCAIDYGACFSCNGRGYEGVLRECSHCNGLGQLPTNNLDDWNDPYCVDCPKCCNGRMSDKPCPICNGDPYRDSSKGKQWLGSDVAVAAGYHHLVAQFPGSRYQITPIRTVLFEFEGGQGLLMPLTT